jgi:SNF family Na+-dependent transporter
VVVVIAFYTDFYYNVVISWGVYYLFGSFVKHLPWSSCGNIWNTKDCYEINSLLNQNKTSTIGQFGNNSLAVNLTNLTQQIYTTSSSEEYFL